MRAITESRDNNILTSPGYGYLAELIPGASLRFNAGADSYVRLIYARGLSRPDPQDIAQPLSWTVSGNGANAIAMWNRRKGTRVP